MKLMVLNTKDHGYVILVAENVAFIELLSSGTRIHFSGVATNYIDVQDDMWLVREMMTGWPES